MAFRSIQPTPTFFDLLVWCLEKNPRHLTPNGDLNHELRTMVYGWKRSTKNNQTKTQSKFSSFSPQNIGGKRNKHITLQKTNIAPGRLTWNIQITHLERKMIFQTSMIMFHVNLPGCSPWKSMVGRFNFLLGGRAANFQGGYHIKKNHHRVNQHGDLNCKLYPRILKSSTKSPNKKNTPPKINMEAKNHPIEKEKSFPKLQFWASNSITISSYQRSPPLKLPLRT